MCVRQQSMRGDQRKGVIQGVACDSPTSTQRQHINDCINVFLPHSAELLRG